MMNAACPREPSSRSTEAITTWTSAMPPFVAQAFWPLITHSSFGLVVLGGGPDRRDVRARIGLGGAEGRDLRLLARCRSTAGIRSPHLLRGPLPEDRGDGERGAHDRHPDPGVAPEELLVGDRQRQARLVGPELGQRLEAVEADLRRLLDHRPGRLLALVPLGGRRPDDLLGEPVDPLADVLLVLVQLEAELGLARVRGRGAVGRLGDQLFGARLSVRSCLKILHQTMSRSPPPVVRPVRAT